MNCWNILGIEEFSDRKTVKLAYAKLLKTTKPDDDPQGFAKLHTAYTDAIAAVSKDLISKKSESTSDQWLSPTRQKPSITIEDALAEDEPEYLEAQNFNKQHSEELQKDWDEFITQAKYVIKSKAKKATVEDWAFIKNIPSMQDLEFHSRAGDWLFERVSAANEKSLERKELLIKPPILDYLNQFFSWDESWREYKQDYGAQTNSVFPYLDLTSKDLIKVKAKELGKDSDYYYVRLMAYMADMALVFIYMGLYYQTKNKIIILLVAAAIYGLIIMPLMEASRYQASLGKMIFKLKVVEKEGERISMLQSFWRMASTVICIIGFPIVIWINTYLYAVQKKDNLFQDIMSKTYVRVREK